MDIIDNKQQPLNKEKRLVSSVQPSQGRPEPIDPSSLLQSIDEPIDSSFIQTMEKDMAALGKSGVQIQPEVKQKAAINPPSGLPVMESAGKRAPEVKGSKPVLSEIVKKEEVVKENLKKEEKKEKEEKKPKKESALLLKIKSLFKSFKLRRKKKEEKPAIQPEVKTVKPEVKPEGPKKPNVFANLLNSLKSKIAKLRARRMSSPKPELLRPKPSGVVLKDPRNKKKLAFGLMSLAAILIIGGIGGFFYWLNYVRQVEPPIALTHFECQDDMCVSVDGEGDNQCQIDTDCQTIEPVVTVPDSLISAAEDKTIELITGQETLLLGQVKDLANQEQATSTINRVLAKVSDGEQKYLNLSELTLALGINIPEAILSAATSDHTLFLYSQEEGNRLGLVIKMGESETLVQDLKNWESTMTDDLKNMFLTDDVPSLSVIEFYDNIYNNADIRYINLLGPGLTVDYALVNGNLVITTSKESMFAVIDTIISMDNTPKGKSCAQENSMCGGIAGTICCDGLTCQLDGEYPDASGSCIKEEPQGCKDLCGDDICQENVCQRTDCPCAETAESCPVDCVQ